MEFPQVDEDGPARKIDAVGVAQVGKAEMIGVVAVEQAVLVDHGVHQIGRAHV